MTGNANGTGAVAPRLGLRSADQLALLRCLGILLQLLLTFFAADRFNLSIQAVPVTTIFILEAGYLLLTLWLREPLFARDSGVFCALLIDTLFWISWLYFSGGATNAFISLLLLPIALAAVTLPMWAPWGLTALSTLAYSLMIFSVPESGMAHQGAGHAAMVHEGMVHQDMAQLNMAMGSHYLGMWVNFLLSALALTTSVALIAKRLRRQDAELALMREAQLRQEQILALGTASAQMAHQLATPLSSLRLLLDEVKEDLGDELPSVGEMETALGRCEHTLAELRLATESIRDRRQEQTSIGEFIQALQQKTLLLMPQAQLTWCYADEAQSLERALIYTDASLSSAVMALIENAIRASAEHTGSQDVAIDLARTKDGGRFIIGIRDFGTGIAPERLAQLGNALVARPKGMGMALMLSHASLERLGGSLVLGNHPLGGTLAEVSLAMVNNPG